MLVERPTNGYLSFNSIVRINDKIWFIHEDGDEPTLEDVEYRLNFMWSNEDV